MQVGRLAILWISLDARSAVLVPPEVVSELWLRLQNLNPLVFDGWSLEQRQDDISLVPIIHGLAVSLEMLRNMVAAISPAAAKMRAEAATPSGAGLSLVLRCFQMSVSTTCLAVMPSLMVVEEILLEKVDGSAKPTSESEAAFLIRLLVSLPIVLLDEGLLARGTPVAWLSLRSSTPLGSRHACCEAVPIRRDLTLSRLPL